MNREKDEQFHRKQVVTLKKIDADDFDNILTTSPNMIIFQHDHRTQIVSMRIDPSYHHSIFLD